MPRSQRGVSLIRSESALSERPLMPKLRQTGRKAVLVCYKSK
jgi:hypothetical protein